MRRFLLINSLQPSLLEAQLPPHCPCLVLRLNAPKSGRILRAEANALWMALRAHEKNVKLKYHLVIQSGQLKIGNQACWVAITGKSNNQLLDAARVFDVHLRKHVSLFAEDPVTSGLNNLELLHDLERRKGWRMAFIHGELDLLREHLKIVPEETLSQFPRLRLARIWLMCKDSRIHEAEREWGRFRLDLAHGQYPQIPVWEAGLVRELVAVHSESPVTPARHVYLEQLIQKIPLQDSDAIGIAHHCLWYLAFESGDITRALVAAEASDRAYADARCEYGHAFIYYHHGITQAAVGRFFNARDRYQKGLALSERRVTLGREQIATGQALMAGIDYVMNQTRRAAEVIDMAVLAIEQGESWSHLLWLVYRTSIQLAALENDSTVFARALSHAREVAINRGFTRLKAQLDLLEIEINLRHANVKIARRLAQQMGLADLVERPIERDLGWRQTTLHARWLLLLLRLPQAKPSDRDKVQALLEESCRLQDFELRIRALLLRAQMDFSFAEREAALEAVDEVLALLLLERPIRLLLDYPGIGLLLAQYQRAVCSRQTIRKLIGWVDELERAARHDAHLARSRLHRVALTAREFDVLRELAQGCRNKEIAQRLKCSANTVKYHLKCMNEKFSTHKRGELLAAAREAGVFE